MDITNFQIGDVVTRIKPAGGDHSYIGEAMTFEGIDPESKILVFGTKWDHVTVLSYAARQWNSDWAKFPTEMVSAVIKKYDDKRLSDAEKKNTLDGYGLARHHTNTVGSMPNSELGR